MIFEAYARDWLERQNFSKNIRKTTRQSIDYICRAIFYTSAVYAFKAECDMPSVASIIGYNKTMEMFRNPEKFDLYERKKSRSVNSYFDELYFGEQREE